MAERDGRHGGRGRPRRCGGDEGGADGEDEFERHVAEAFEAQRLTQRAIAASVDDLCIERVGAGDVVVDADVGEDGFFSGWKLGLQGCEAGVEVCDHGFSACGLAHQFAEAADVGAHVGEAVFGRECFNAIAEADQQRRGRGGGELSGEDEVGIQPDHFFGEAVIDGELCGDAVEAERCVHRLL